MRLPAGRFEGLFPHFIRLYVQLTEFPVVCWLFCMGLCRAIVPMNLRGGFGKE